MAGHESRDVDLRKVLFTGTGILGLIAVALLLSALTYSLWKLASPSPGARPETITSPGTLPPAPDLQVDPHADLLRLRAAEDSVLERYGWVNRDSGLVRIPVARAMERVVEKGLPHAGDNRDTLGEK